MKFLEITSKWRTQKAPGKGYWRVEIKLPDGSRQRMPYSKYIVEAVLGRALPPKAVIHHVDGDSLYDSTENLVVCEDENYHNLLHVRAKALKSTGNVNSRKCRICKCWGVPGEGDMVVYSRNDSPNGIGRSCHKSCHNLKQNKRKEWKTIEQKKSTKTTLQRG